MTHQWHAPYLFLDSRNLARAYPISAFYLFYVLVFTGMGVLRVLGGTKSLSGDRLVVHRYIHH